jgi:transcriptional regulator with XRE-family HTH domain
MRCLLNPVLRATIALLSGLSQEQVHYFTGITQSQLARFESGILSAGVDHIETKLLPSKFFSSPRFAREISEYFKEKHGVKLTTTRLSKALDGFVRKGLIEKLETDKKGKFQDRAKG